MADRDSLVARVLVKCPADGRAVPTGHRMKEAQLEASSGRYSFRCGACGQIHQWIKTDAWIEAASKY